MKPTYFISMAGNAGPQKETIHDPLTKLKVRVIDRVRKKNEATKRRDEVQYFVTSGEEVLAFESRGYNKHNNLLILQMIATYCMYLGLIKARIHAGWPI